LDELDNFDALSSKGDSGGRGWDRGKLFGEIDRLVANGMIEMVQSDYNRFVKVMSLTIKGRNEITHPTLEAKRLGNRVDFSESVVSDSDRETFVEFGDFLEMYNNEQKKAIISSAKKLLCVAGAGSGKTTVLTKRIEFLVKYRNVEPVNILAITFTRKARLEMEKRLKELRVFGVKVHTFNSFCEGILQRNGSEIYGRTVRVLSYGDKILAMNMAIASLGLDMERVVDEYFNAGQKKFRTASQLTNAFMSDCFSVMGYFKVSGKKDYDFSNDFAPKGVPSAQMASAGANKVGNVNEQVNVERIFKITKLLREHMEMQGLRDYSDQILDTIKFFKMNSGGIPKFEHVLVDEYQDVNAGQIELIGLLNAPNLFAVGDPRQSIFGWRGSDVNYILNFEKDFGDAEIVHLKRNYRSLKGVVDFMNMSIADMKLPDLDSHLEGEARIRIDDFASEEAERDFVLREIEDSDMGLDEIFVLARTNKILMELSQAMKMKGVEHNVRSDESAGKVNGTMKGVTLATVHAIKGLEAKKVFVIGASESNFPCKASDHPAVEMVKADDYDREEEERRLFYVAVSRAREELVVTHTRKPTYYITNEMRALAGGKEKGVMGKVDLDEGLVGELKSWRSVVSGEAELPAYCVLSNATLIEIAEKMPKDAEELMKVSGIGPDKLMKYGEKILNIVGDFVGES